MDGLELSRRIRASESSRYSYILLLTALHGKTNYLTAMDAGIDDLMLKPYDADELRARLCVAERIVGLRTTSNVWRACFRHACTAKKSVMNAAAG